MTKRTPRCEVFIDGASRGNPGPAGVGVAVYADGVAEPVRTLSKRIGDTTNNVAEYLGLIYGLQEALLAGAKDVVVKTDSELLARQINGQYKVRDPNLKIFHDLAKHLAAAFKTVTVMHIPREQNTVADKLAARAAADGVRQASLFDN